MLQFLPQLQIAGWCPAENGEMSVCWGCPPRRVGDIPLDKGPEASSETSCFGASFQSETEE
jgi:hypothetical protein